MRLEDVAVATITLASTDAEEARLRAALTRLAALRVRIAVADGGSGTDFIAFLHTLPAVVVAEPGGPGLVRQVQASLAAALRGDARRLLYLEPDKLAFIDRHLARVVADAPDDDAVGIVLAARSASAFATFPAFQQLTESLFNRLCGVVTGVEGDYCYGPFLVSPSIATLVAGVPADLGWGWRPHMTSGHLVIWSSGHLVIVAELSD